MELYWTYISVLCISRHIAVKYLHYSRHRRGEFAKCPQSKNNKEQSISLSLPFYEMTWGRRWFYCWKVESPELSASFSESSKVAAFMKCILMLHLRRATEIFFIYFFEKRKAVIQSSPNKSLTCFSFCSMLEKFIKMSQLQLQYCRLCTQGWNIFLLI